MELNDIIDDTTAISDISSERRFCILAITSTPFLRAAYNLFSDVTLFDSSFVRTTLTWALKYYNKYNIAINKHIIGVYDQEKNKLSEIQSREIVEFLQSLSEEFEQSPLQNVKGDVDFLVNYLKVQQIKRLQKKLDKFMLTGKVLESEAEIASFNTVKIAKSEAREITENFDRYNEEQADPDYLFTMEGAYGEMFGKVKRGHITMVAAEAKVGKSRSMVKLASTALKNGFNVFVVNLEMRQHEMEQLIDQEVLKITHKAGTAVIPYFVKNGEKFDIKFMKKEYKGATKEDFKNHWKAEKLFNPHAQIITRTFPQKTAMVSDIKAELEILRDTHNFVPDVIIVDYADLLGVELEDRFKDVKYQIMGSRRKLKQLAQEMNVHVHTASQAHSGGNDVKGDKDKLSDVDVLIGLNYETAQHKEMGVLHATCVVNRHVYFNLKDRVIILTNYGIGQSMLDSIWEKDLGAVNKEGLGDNFSLFKEDREEAVDYDDFSDYF